MIGEPLGTRFGHLAWFDLFARVAMPLGIRTWLFALAVSAVLPVLLFAGTTAQRVAATERRATLADLEHRTDATARKIERYLQTLEELAVTLAHSPPALTGDLQAFYDFARRAAAAGKVGHAVALARPDGQLLLSTRRPFGEVLPRGGDPQAMSQASTSKAPYISDLFKGSVSGTNVFAVWAPVVHDGEVIALVGVVLEPQDLTAALLEERLPDSWIGAVVDRNGSIVARTRDAEIVVGSTATAELRQSIAAGQRGVFHSVTASGTAVFTSYRYLTNANWAIAIGVPRQLIEAPALASLKFMLALGLASLSMAATLAYLVGRHMSRQVTDIARAAQAVGAGQKPDMKPSSVTEFAAVSRALTTAQGLIWSRAAALRDSEADFRGFFENAAVGMAQIDMTGRFKRVNERYCEITGYGHDELLGGMGPLDLDHPDDRDADRERLAHFFQGEPYEAEKRYLHKDGRTVWVRVAATLFGDDHDRLRHYTAGVIEDITARKQAELALKEATRLTTVACEAGRMGTWHLDVAANRLDNSDEALALVGIRREDWLGTPEALEARVHPADIENRRRDRARALSGGAYLDHDFRVRLPDGEERWLHSRGRIERDASGKAREAFGVMLDITERKRAEAQKTMLIRELDHRVKNTLARVQAIVLRSREGAATIDALLDSLIGRLEALGQAHSVLSRGGWTGGSLAQLVRQEIEPYATSSNVVIDGPEIVLNPEATLALVLTLHELATNAAKYGALSPMTPNGRVAVRWHRNGNATSMPTLLIEWRESDGPPVAVTARVGPNSAANGTTGGNATGATLAHPDFGRGSVSSGGYGSSVIRSLIPYELPGSTVELDIAADGVLCRIEIPLTALAAAEPHQTLPA